MRRFPSKISMTDQPPSKETPVDKKVESHVSDDALEFEDGKKDRDSDVKHLVFNLKTKMYVKASLNQIVSHESDVFQDIVENESIVVI